MEYYSLLSGLPFLRLEDADQELEVSLSYVRSLIEDEEVQGRDRKLLDLFFLRGDCRNLLLLLEDSSAELPYSGRFSRTELQEMIADALEDVFTDDPRFPSFMAPFVREYVEKRRQAGYFAEDRIMLRYWEYLQQEGTPFIRRWAKLNMNISNILTALICRQQGWNIEDYIYGENDVTYMIRTRQSQDFDLGKELDYMPQLMQIVSETDPVQKERRIDALKWVWLDDETFQNAFDINAMYAYLLKVEMLERWAILDPEQGKARFQEIIEDLRSEAKVPAEYTTYMKAEGTYQK